MLGNGANLCTPTEGSGLIVGRCHKFQGQCSTIAGGENNIITSIDHGFIGAGSNNCVGATRGGILAGLSNVMSSTSADSVIVGGECNSITGANNIIGGGNQNSIGGCCSFLGGGTNNCVSSGQPGAVIVGGSTNCVSTYGQSAIVGGQCNKVDCFCLLAGFGHISNGLCNVVGQNGQYSFIGNGFRNQTSGSYSAILGGCCNKICCAHCESFIVGSDLTSCAACTTHVNCLNVNCLESFCRVYCTIGVGSNCQFVSYQKYFQATYNRTCILANLGSSCRFQIIAAPGSNCYRIFDDAYFFVCMTGNSGTFPTTNGNIVVTQTGATTNQSVVNFPSVIMNCVLQVIGQTDNNAMYFRKVPTGATAPDARLYRNNQPTCLLFGSGLSNLGTRFCCLTIMMSYREMNASHMV